VLAKARAVPMNFFHVLLNPKKLDWLKCGQPTGPLQACGYGAYQPWQDCAEAYLKLVTEAADQANGHAFVTEYAGDAAIMKDQVYKEGDYNTEPFKTITKPWEFLEKLLFDGWPRSSLMQQVIKTHIPKPDESTLPGNCKSDRDFYNTFNLQECIKHMPEGWVFDPVAFAADLDERIVQPLKDAQALFADHPYMTRFFTTISPDEMTKDPVFSFNPGLPGVPNVHAVTATPKCPPGETTVSDGITLTWPNGESIDVAGTYQDCSGFIPEEGATTVDEDGPSGAQIQILGEEGAPLTVASGDVDKKEAEIDARAPTPGAADVPAEEDADSADLDVGLFGPIVDKTSPGKVGGGKSAGGGGGGGSSGCVAGTGGTGALGVLLLLLCIAGVLRTSRE